MKITGFFRRQTKGCGYVANVYLDIQFSETTDITIGSERFENSGTQGEIVWIPSNAGNFESWFSAAMLGLKYGLLKTDKRCKIVIEKIEGLFTDTNPLIIAVASIFGVWEFLNYIPSEEEKNKIENWALDSWKVYKDKLPTELEDLKASA